MNDPLDDLADVVNPSRQHVPVRRMVPLSRPAELPVPLAPVVHVHQHPPAPPTKRTSPFSAGFFGALGVLAAVVAVWAGIYLARAGAQAIIDQRNAREAAEQRAAADAEREKRLAAAAARNLPSSVFDLPPAQVRAQSQGIAPPRPRVMKFTDSVSVKTEQTDADRVLISGKNLSSQTFHRVTLIVKSPVDRGALGEIELGDLAPGDTFGQFLAVPNANTRLNGRPVLFQVRYLGD